MSDGIQIISAPSILGLKPTGVQFMAEALLATGLLEKLPEAPKPIHVPTLNHLYSTKRDQETNCINAVPVRTFSIHLGEVISEVLEQNAFPIVLGGDCGILVGIMGALKTKGNYGLLFMDAHADFYEPGQSPTGEVADMDLAIVTGRGPELLTNINGLKPYVRIENVVHIGQRDQDEIKKYQGLEIRTTQMHCIDADAVHTANRDQLASDLLSHINHMHDVNGFWLHFDTDVLADSVNPAVDYRLPGGLSAEETQWLLTVLLNTGRITGMSVTIYNPELDNDGGAGRTISDIVANAFDSGRKSMR